MIKIIKKCKNTDLTKEKGVVVVSRVDNKICLHNIETNADISFDAASGRVTMNFDLQNGEIIMIGDKNGFAKKSEIKDDRA